MSSVTVKVPWATKSAWLKFCKCEGADQLIAASTITTIEELGKTLGRITYIHGLGWMVNNGPICPSLGEAVEGEANDPVGCLAVDPDAEGAFYALSDEVARASGIQRADDEDAYNHIKRVVNALACAS